MVDRPRRSRRSAITVGSVRVEYTCDSINAAGFVGSDGLFVESHVSLIVVDDPVGLEILASLLVSFLSVFPVVLLWLLYVFISSGVVSAFSIVVIDILVFCVLVEALLCEALSAWRIITFDVGISAGNEVCG